jgi:large subunit ribosomal protein L13
MDTKMKTFSAKPAEVDKKWVMIDADGLVVGRLASLVAMRLRGKHKPTLHAACRLRRQRHRHQRRQGGADRPQGRAKIYYKHTGYIGGIKERTAKSILAGRFPERIVEKAVERMLPRGPLGRRQLGNLRVYPHAEHPHAAQQPEQIDIAAMNRKNKRTA